MGSVMNEPKTRKQLVDYRTEGGVAIVELNDPPANVYSLEMMRQLDEAVVRPASTTAPTASSCAGTESDFSRRAPIPG